MKLLVLGGTGWLGAALANDALVRGHAVACLARGSERPPPAGARFVRADRDGTSPYEGVANEPWDAVVELTSRPSWARDAAVALAPCIAHAVVVSSASVYAATDVPGHDATAATLDPLADDVDVTGSTYGAAKVACERHARTAFGAERTLVVRAGLIGGPGDASDRSGYWPLRFARPADAAGRVLVPDLPALPTQLVDVRDLAAWIVDAAARQVAGVVDAVGPTRPFAEHLATARTVAGHAGPLLAVDESWLAAHGVRPWAGPRSLPLWVPSATHSGFGARRHEPAHALGLVARPLENTLRDVLAWELGRPPSGAPRKAGLADDEERELLADATGIDAA